MKARALPFACAALVVLGALAIDGQNNDPPIPPGDNFVVDGLPPIPASLAETVGRYTDFRRAGFADWHPVRREMLITTRFSDTPQVHRVKFPGGARTQLTFFPDPIGETWTLYEPRTGDYFLFAKDRGGDEFSQGYRYDLATGAIARFTDGGRSQNAGFRWSTSGDRITYSSTKRNGRDRDIYVVDPRNPSTERRLLQVEGGGWFALDWSPDDKQVVVSELISVSESYLWLVNVATGEKTLVTPKGGAEKVAYRGASFTGDGKGLYVTTDRQSEFLRLARVDLATRAHTYYTTGIPWDVRNFELSPDGKTIAFVTNEEGANVLRLLDTTTGKEKPKPALGLGAGLISGVAWHKNGKDLAFTFNGAQTPADVYSLDVVSGTIDRWTESETGGLNARSFPPAELVRWKSFDGRAISGFLYKPPSRFTGKRPVIVTVHGGPEDQSLPIFLGRWNYFLNELGIAIVYPNVRGSTGFGKTFATLDNGARREDSVKDVGALLDWIATRPDLDASRIVVTGGSYGGYVALAVATHYNDRICCTIDVVGISNFVTFLESTEAYRRDLRRPEYGDERDPEMRKFLQRISPITNARNITKPLFVVQGRNDPRVPYTESEQMVATIKKNGGPVWFLMANDEGHGFAKKRNQDFLFYATARFIQEHLLK